MSWYQYILKCMNFIRRTKKQGTKALLCRRRKTHFTPCDMQDTAYLERWSKELKFIELYWQVQRAPRRIWNKEMRDISFRQNVGNRSIAIVRLQNNQVTTATQTQTLPAGNITEAGKFDRFLISENDRSNAGVQSRFSSNRCIKLYLWRVKMVQMWLKEQKRH